MVGNERHLRLGKHTGSTFVRRLLKRRQIEANEKEMELILYKVKELPEVTEEDFWKIVGEVIPEDRQSGERELGC